MSKELKPCPFCSSWAHAAHHTARNKDDDYYLVMCSRCFARTVGNTVDEAIAAWNRRVEPKRGEWVSVTERMPKHGYVYWVADGYTIKTAYLDGAMDWVDSGNHILKYVTHWMPLPEPPKEG